jgi:hypothetical protein
VINPLPIPLIDQGLGGLHLAGVLAHPRWITWTGCSSSLAGNRSSARWTDLRRRGALAREPEPSASLTSLPYWSTISVSDRRCSWAERGDWRMEMACWGCLIYLSTTMSASSRCMALPRGVLVVSPLSINTTRTYQRRPLWSFLASTKTIAVILHSCCRSSHWPLYIAATSWKHHACSNLAETCVFHSLKKRSCQEDFKDRCRRLACSTV